MNNAPSSSARLHLSLGFATLFVLIAGFGSWAAFSSISGAVIAPGDNSTLLDEQVVQHPNGGVVSEIHIRNGDIVDAGDILLVLDGTLALAELNTTHIRQAELMARGARLEAERNGSDHVLYPARLAQSQDADILLMLAGQDDIFEARNETRVKESQSLDQRRLQIEAQIQGTIAERDATEIQMEIISGEVDDQKELFDKGLSPAARLNALKRQEAGLQGAIGRLSSQIGQAREKITELETDFLRRKLNLQEENATELREIRSELLNLAEQEIALQDRLDRLDIRAPIGGMVHGLKVHTLESVVSPADALVQIVPVGQGVVISTRVQPINIDEIHAGQAASLRFSALNQRITPVLSGQVTRISADAFIDPNTGASFYQVEISPDPGEMQKLGDMSPVPGMPVEGYISTASRSPLNYLLKPFMDYFSRALRES